MINEEELRNLIRDIPDFPKPGILFRDITPLIADARALAAMVDLMAAPFLGKVDTVLGIESRGFIIGAPVAYRLGLGLTIARKPGKLPYEKIAENYDLEYGSAGLEIHSDGLKRGARTLIVDDLLATGGTAEAAVRLATQLGAEVVACAFVIELAGLAGRERLAPINCFSLIRYD
ncbi:MAG TPA: adenine phosphoribosyltransferase [Candidatus Binataceae bacterium]|nr:adenine phosphoribosyltransferase [Candidatus Binataceae bacterium]